VARTKNQDSLHWRRKSREKGRGEVEGRSWIKLRDLPTRLWRHQICYLVSFKLLFHQVWWDCSTLYLLCSKSCRSSHRFVCILVLEIL
jgi:hypothetical protein